MLMRSLSQFQAICGHWRRHRDELDVRSSVTSVTSSHLRDDYMWLTMVLPSTVHTMQVLTCYHMSYEVIWCHISVLNKNSICSHVKKNMLRIPRLVLEGELEEQAVNIGGIQIRGEPNELKSFSLNWKAKLAKTKTSHVLQKPNEYGQNWILCNILQALQGAMDQPWCDQVC